MSYRVVAPPVADDRSDCSSASSSSGDEDDRVSDWASSLGEARQTKSLFDETVLPTPEAALEHDANIWDFRLSETCEKLGLEMFGRIRLINLIRNAGLTKDQIEALNPSDALFKDDNLLIPVIPDDPLLQYDFDDSWSDDDEFDRPPISAAGPSQTQASGSTSAADSNTSPEAQKLAALEAELGEAREKLEAMRVITSRIIAARNNGDEAQPEISASLKYGSKGKGKAVERDDDTHYFHSYEENDIHEIMLKDTVRTVSYARFILSNPNVFKNAVVMDVGCGTGILSMLAAKAGAKHVYAIEASRLAVKARENINKNGFSDKITVIQGKVEDIELPVKTVDVIVSEWMGYMLLYESMLDSVLVARDRFLAPSGLMAPSQTRLVLSAITGDRVWKERVAFWPSVYGFDLSVMQGPCFGEGLTEVVDKEEVVTTEAIVRDINSHSATIKSLDFHSAFTLEANSNSNSSGPTTIRAFLTHFDTFFSPHSGAEKSHVPPSEDVEILPFGDDEYERPVQPLEQSNDNGVQVSFTTGPRGKYTHWKQVVFLLREPITLQNNGDKIQGRFFCRKSEDNSRELDVEIHFRVVAASSSDSESGTRGETYSVQAYKVR
ncbi:protein arginine N-methyltransferase 3 [Kwoniella heveanensis BCC8398]|uniref:type I protein arginine methyltransferase n=1 Tax=Kwoniella heveanensis BCC8398 TaxID=1296120 RepID=A0A1B9GW08_9TREE|nr:protein arginine N-methyltransferase 3 [Kwoniella heveanensis BCC8398]